MSTGTQPRRVRVGFASAEHLHFSALMRAALECNTADVVGMSIADAEHRAFLADRFPSVPVFETDTDLFDRGQPEAIVTTHNNRDAVEVVCEAARRGIHVMKEKPMASTLAGADRMVAACSRHGVRLMVNWPTNWSPAIHHAKSLVDSGAIGQVWQVYNRSGHGGPPRDFMQRDPVARVGWGWLMERDLNGGGASVDFCSYGVVASLWFMGRPGKVIAFGGRYSKDYFTVDDNATVLLGYPHGHSVAEGTWTQPAAAHRIPLMIYGTEGSIAVTRGNELQLATRPPAGQQPEVQLINAPDLPAHLQSGVAHFTHCIITGEDFVGLVGGTMGRDAQEVIEAASIAMRTGGTVSLPLPGFLA
ncbi:MAG: Gfo/Idh/MocA family oxidoreductase [Chloroflexi bacterium]|jgi:predicted dehydrogenase|nr:Gfo/Idh/MocA family oxidoreductase [Chloroflexota bacterium]